jgi:REP element-mobilizing transposase RayT
MRQCPLAFRTWGGARAGAGRKPKGQRAGVSHLPRPVHSQHHPLHVTLRVRREVPGLREWDLFVEVRRALVAGRERFGFRLVHFSVQRDHLHLIAEAANRHALSRGVQGLSIRVARAINRQLHRRGKVFADRYHARALKTPRAARWALRYVLLNARKHERGAGAVPFGFVDACSSAAWFDGFARPTELVFGARECRREFKLRHALDSPVVSARTWLLTGGQRRVAPFDIDDAPSGA